MVSRAMSRSACVSQPFQHHGLPQVFIVGEHALHAAELRHPSKVQLRHGGMEPRPEQRHHESGNVRAIEAACEMRNEAGVGAVREHRNVEQLIEVQFEIHHFQ